MTEAEWAAATDPRPMLAFLAGRVSDRKLRLFACACVRLVWERVTDGRLRRAVETAERYADRRATDAELRASFADVESLWTPGAGNVATLTTLPDAYGAAYLVVTPQATYGGGAGFTYYSDFCDDEVGPWESLGGAQAALLRDIVGNPFRPVALAREWQSDAARATARAAYAERGFDRLPTVADTLEAGGCTADALLTHLRGAGPHVRGCWALDLILGQD